MTDFFALIGNPAVQTQFPHVVLAGLATGAFFMLGVSAYRLWRNSGDLEPFRRSFTVGAVAALLGSLFLIPVGHAQAQRLVQAQPMKMAAAEALWDSEDPAALSIFTWGDEKGRKDVFSIRISPILTVLSYGATTGEVKGIKNLEEEYAQKYGPGEYVPSVFVSYWSFRGMVGAGFAMLALALLALYLSIRSRWRINPRVLQLLMLAMALPYIGNSTGWILTEMGRQPWIVFGLMKTAQGVSPTISSGMVLFSVAGFTLLYGLLALADLYLLAKFARGEATGEMEASPAEAF